MDSSSENHSLVDPLSSDNAVAINFDNKSHKELQYSEARLNSQQWNTTKPNIHIDFNDLIYSASTVREGKSLHFVLTKIISFIY